MDFFTKEGIVQMQFYSILKPPVYCAKSQTSAATASDVWKLNSRTKMQLALVVQIAGSHWSWLQGSLVKPTAHRLKSAALPISNHSDGPASGSQMRPYMTSKRADYPLCNGQNGEIQFTKKAQEVSLVLLPQL